MEGQPKEEELGGRNICVSLRAGAVGNRLAESQKLLPFGYSGVYGESLEGFGRAEECKVPTYFEAIAILKDLLAYRHVWGRMTFDIGEKDDEARGGRQSFGRGGDNHNSQRQSESARESYGKPRQYAFLKLLSPAL